MSNALTLGLYAGGNALPLYASVPSSGLAYGAATATAVAFYNGLSVGAATVTGIGLVTISATGDAAGEAITVVAQGMSTRGNGLAYGVATVIADNAYVIGTAAGAATVSGEGLSFSRFAPYLLWPGYSSDGTAITIPLADLNPILDAAEAHTTTGDWRKIMQSLLLHASEFYLNIVLSGETPPSTYRSKVVVNHDARHPVLGQTYRRSCRSHFNITFPSRRMADEP